MEKIFYDFQAFDMQTHGGITRYFSELYKEINKENELICKILLNKTQNIYLKELGFKYSNTNAEENLKYSLNILSNDKDFIFHPTFFTSNYFIDVIKEKNIPFVMTIHDMIPEIYNWGDNYFQTVNKRIQAPIADAIIVPSENTKKDVIKFLNIPEDKINVIHHGYDSAKNNIYTDIINEDYILFVGGRINYKKWHELVLSFNVISKVYPNLKLVCTSSDFNIYEKQFIKDLGLENKIIHKYVNDEDLRNLYHFAKVFVFPSEYEGFGLPILEAFNESCVTLLYNGHCFPEIGDNGALYFDKYEELPNMLYKSLMLTDIEKKEIINNQKKILKKFSWKKSAMKHVEVYKKLLKNKIT